MQALDSDVDRGSDRALVGQQLVVEPRSEDAALSSVEGGNVNFYETRCTLEQVKRLLNANPNDKNQVNAEADLSCSGEGSRWKAKEIWHVETIDGNKVVVVTGLKQTDYRDEKGRKQNTPSLVTTTVYFACK